MRFLRIGLVLGLLATAACGSDTESTASTAATTQPPPQTTAPPATTEPATTTTTVGTTTSTTNTTAPTTAVATTDGTAPTLVDVKVYFLRDERLAITHRLVPGPGVMRAALNELLAGPTPEEAAAGLSSTVPDGTELLGLNLAGGLATVDLNSQFESGGGSLSMMARIAQVVFTATQFDNSDRVLFWLDGEPIEYLGGEGIVLDEPQARMDVDRTISGAVIIERPAYGAIVGSTFTVTGEGDVFEAQFPIEVWSGTKADGELIERIGPVTAGAWGTWADFEVTITIDAPDGPIELVAYDPGGCGTGPECPEIIETHVPLTLAN
jgi:germination protein M